MIRQTGRENLEQIAQHSADPGWSGLTYHSDTIKFFRAHRSDIMALAEQLAGDLGEDVLAMIANFGCLRNEKLTGCQISQALNSRGDDVTSVQNAMTWFAAEEIARELNPDA